MPESGEHRPNQASPPVHPPGEAVGLVRSIAGLFDPPQGPDEIGRVAGYRVLKLLGEGGMGCVYLAEDTRSRRPVALKFLLLALAQDRISAERFLREGRAAARVRHENVITIYEVGDVRGLPFIAMEYLRGKTLQDFMRTKGRPSRQHSVRICKEVLAGLHAAHELGLVHRDIKPANVWLEPPKGKVTLLDFGLAVQPEADTRLTGTGMVIGTPLYMSPEQARSEAVDRRSDLFSIGSVLYELTTGRLPFEGDNPIAVMMSVAFDDPPPVRHWNPQVPKALEALIGRMMAKDPKDRPQTALAAIQELDSALSEPGRPGLPPPAPTKAAPAAPPLRGADTPRLASGDTPRLARPRPAPTPPTPARAPKPRPTPVEAAPPEPELPDDEPPPPRGKKSARITLLDVGFVLAIAVLLTLAFVAIAGMLGLSAPTGP